MLKEFSCKYCGSSFERNVYPSSSKTKLFFFCSPSCRNKSRELKSIPCPRCGSLFKPDVIDIHGVRRQYCSKGCAYKASRGKPSKNPLTHNTKEREFIIENYPKNGTDWVAEKLKLTSKVVGLLAHKLGVKLDKDVYRKKVHGAAKENMLGAKNPNWQGGVTCQEWGDNWQSQKLAARERDKHKCQVCGVFDKHISVHHIKPRRLFLGRMEDANVLSNLICLCNKHHIPVEMGKIPCPTPKA